MEPPPPRDHVAHHGAHGVHHGAHDGAHNGANTPAQSAHHDYCAHHGAQHDAVGKGQCEGTRLPSPETWGFGLWKDSDERREADVKSRADLKASQRRAAKAAREGRRAHGEQRVHYAESGPRYGTAAPPGSPIIGGAPPPPLAGAALSNSSSHSPSRVSPSLELASSLAVPPPLLPTLTAAPPKHEPSRRPLAPTPITVAQAERPSPKTGGGHAFHSAFPHAFPATSGAAELLWSDVEVLDRLFPPFPGVSPRDGALSWLPSRPLSTVLGKPAQAQTPTPTFSAATFSPGGVLVQHVSRSPTASRKAPSPPPPPPLAVPPPPPPPPATPPPVPPVLVPPTVVAPPTSPRDLTPASTPLAKPADKHEAMAGALSEQAMATAGVRPWTQDDVEAMHHSLAQPTVA